MSRAVGAGNEIKPPSTPVAASAGVTYPRDLSIDMLADEQYMYESVISPLIRSAHHNHRVFCVAVTTAFHCIVALDRLMIAVKELVGETYYIAGLAHGSQGYADTQHPQGTPGLRHRGQPGTQDHNSEEHQRGRDNAVYWNMRPGPTV
jgi:hypothetical protein